MTSIQQIRDALAEYVPDAVEDSFPPEHAGAGEYPSTAIWNDDARLVVHGPAIGESSTQPYFEFAADAEVDIEHALGQELGEQVSRAALVRGTDAFAYYVPFHQRGAQWGIYLPVIRLREVATEILGPLHLSFAKKVLLAANLMHRHEMFHFAVEYMTSLWELAHHNPCWKPGRQLTEKCGYFPLEEKLANAYMLRGIAALPDALTAPDLMQTMLKFVAQQPEGYRDAPDATDPQTFRAECARLCMDYVDQWNGGQAPEEVFCPVVSELLLLDGRLDWRYCPIHIVHDATRSSLADLKLTIVT